MGLATVSLWPLGADRFERLGVGTLLRDGSLLALAIAITVGAFAISRRKRAQVDAQVSSSTVSAPQHAE